MEVSEMIDEWFKGCSCSIGHPIECKECTLALIKAIDIKALSDQVKIKCDDIISEYGIAGVAMATAHSAISGITIINKIKDRYERINTKD